MSPVASEQIRLGIVVSSLTGGGAERQASLWATVCAGLGHDVSVLTLRRAEDEFPLPPTVTGLSAGKTGRFDVARPVRAIRRLARGVEVLVAFQPYCALLCALARLSVPYLVVTGDDPRRFGDTSRVPPAAYRIALERAAIRSAPTSGLVECYRELGIGRSLDWICIPNLVDEAAFADWSGAKAGTLFVGRLVPEKDPLLAAEVARRAASSLTILGQGPLRAQLDGLSSAGTGGSVILRPFTSEPWQLYASHRVCLVTSQYEAFGNVIVESLAAGTPVVAADCDFGPREILAGAVHSRVVPRDPHALAAELAAVVNRPYTEEEADGCREVASRYRAASVGPLIQHALEATLTARVQ